MKNAVTLLVSCCFFLWLSCGPECATCSADVFTLRSGDVVEGQLYRETEKTYLVLVKHLDGQKMVTLKKRDVVSRAETHRGRTSCSWVSIDIKSESLSGPRNRRARTCRLSRAFTQAG